MNQALAASRPAVASTPDVAEVFVTLGDACRILGRPREAIGHYQKALALKPPAADVHNNLAGVLHMAGHPEDAVRHYERALSERPDYVEAHYNLANLLHELGRDDDAIRHYGEALRHRPGFAEAHNNLANVLQKCGRHDEAVAEYEAALLLKPEYAVARHNLGKALYALNRNREAVAAFEKALAANSSNAALHNDLAAAHLVMGEIDEACAAFEKAAALVPRNAAIHLNLAGLKPFRPGDPRLVALEKLAEDAPSLGESDRIALHFALGKAHADLKNPERSFRHYLTGNALKRDQITYDEKATLAALECMRAAFMPALIEAKRGCGDPSRVPVFIVGMLRSGTTLLEQILASHPAVFAAGEIDDFAEAAISLVGARGAAEHFPESIAALSHDQLRRLGGHYVAALMRKAPDARRIVDKMPANFAYAGLIHLALPNARIIHARRDPVDTCLSCFTLLFADNQPHTYDLAELGRYYRAYDALMRHWQTILPPGVMIDVHYEDVVRDLEREARRLVAHCGLEWDAQCLAFDRMQRPVHTASVTQVRRPIYRDSVGRWRPYAEFLKPLRDALENIH